MTNQIKFFVCFMVIYWLLPSSVLAEVDRPNLRYESDNLYLAYPGYEDFEDFMASFDFDEEKDDLFEDSQDRRRQIQELESIDFANIPVGRRFVLHKQLMNLLLEEATYSKFVSMVNYRKEMEDWRVERLDGPQPFVDLKKVQSLVLKAVGIARIMVRDYTFDEERSMFQLIRLMARSQNSNLFFYFDQFKRKFASSPYLASAHHAVGEYYFQAKDWNKAEESLKAAMKVKDNPTRPYSVYKLAWVHVLRSQEEKDQAKKLEHLQKAVVAFRLSSKLLEDWNEYEPVFDLEKHVASDLAWTFAAMRKAQKEVIEYFDEMDQDVAYRDYLYYLAVDATRSNEFELASKAFSELIALDDEHYDLPKILLKRAELEIVIKDYTKLAETYDSLNLMLKEGHDWYDQWEDELRMIDISRLNLAYHLRDSAIKVHQEAEVLKNQNLEGQNANVDPKSLPDPKPVYSAARTLYERFLTWYPNHHLVDDLRYNHAMVVFQVEDFEKAAALLSEIAKDQKSKYRKDAAYNAIVAVYSWDSLQEPPSIPELGKATESLILPETKALLIEKIDFFTNTFSDAPEAIPSLYTAAQILFEFGHYPEAVKRYQQIVTSAPKTQEGQSALHTTLGFLMETKKWAELISLCEGFLNDKNIAAAHRKIITDTLNYAKAQN